MGKRKARKSHGTPGMSPRLAAKAPTPWFERLDRPQFLYPLVAGLALGLYLLMAQGDLWLDEIWSFQWVENASSPLDVFLRFRHDNNHPLNTLWLSLVGPGAVPGLIRLPSVLSGVLSAILLLRLARCIDRRSGGIVATLFLGSFPLAVYFSEARGYASAIAFGLAATLVLYQARLIPSWSRAVVFWTLCLGTLLSHASAVLLIGALGLWTLAGGWMLHRNWRTSLTHAASWFGIPSGFLGAYYVVFLRGMEIGGGPEYSVPKVLGDFFAYALGLPAAYPASLVAVGIGAALLVWAGLSLPRPALHLRALLLAILVVPTVALAVARPEILYFRYFLILLPLFYLFAGLALASLLAGSSKIRVVGPAIALAAYLAAQTPSLVAFAQAGRGQYERTLTAIASSPFSDKSVASDHDFRNFLVVDFVKENRPGLSTIAYRPNANHRAHWFLRHSQEALPDKIAPNWIRDGTAYTLVAVFPYGGISGWHWLLYRKKWLPASGPAIEPL